MWHDIDERPSLRRVEVFCERAYIAVEGDWVGPVRWRFAGDAEETVLEGDDLVRRGRGAVASRVGNPDGSFLRAIAERQAGVAVARGRRARPRAGRRLLRLRRRRRRPRRGVTHSFAGVVDLLEGLATTRAIRRIRTDPIPDDDLATILWHATRAPSGSNRQPARFVVLRDGPAAVEAKALLGRSFRAGWAEKAAAERLRHGVGTDPTSPKGRQARRCSTSSTTSRTSRSSCCACLVRYRAPDPTEGASVYPACQNLLLAARALGYGGVLTMWHAVRRGRAAGPARHPRRRRASPPRIPLGRPEGGHGPVRRRPLADVVFDDRWGEPGAVGRRPAGHPVRRRPAATEPGVAA